MKLYDFVFSIYRNNYLTLENLDEQSQKEFNGFMVTRILSIDHNNTDLINSEFNGHYMNIPDQNLYNILKMTFGGDPNRKYDVSYRKDKPEDNVEIIEAVENYFELTPSEARQYLQVLSKDQVIQILFETGWEEEKIKKETKWTIET